LRGEREEFPTLPQGYFDNEASRLVEEFCGRARTERTEKLLRQFPMKAIEGGLQNTWQEPAVSVYRNWIAYLQERKAKRRVPAWPAQRASREHARPATVQLGGRVDKPVAVP
jgi:hypothetical protein